MEQWEEAIILLVQAITMEIIQEVEKVLMYGMVINIDDDASSYFFCQMMMPAVILSMCKLNFHTLIIRLYRNLKDLCIFVEEW